MAGCGGEGGGQTKFTLLIFLCKRVTRPYFVSYKMQVFPFCFSVFTPLNNVDFFFSICLPSTP
jgi:hypothetical protein